MSSLYKKIIAVSLFVIMAVIPLLVNPFTFNWVELIKRESVYALVCLLLCCSIALANKKKTSCACIPCP